MNYLTEEKFKAVAEELTKFFYGAPQPDLRHLERVEAVLRKHASQDGPKIVFEGKDVNPTACAKRLPDEEGKAMRPCFEPKTKIAAIDNVPEGKSLSDDAYTKKLKEKFPGINFVEDDAALSPSPHDQPEHLLRNLLAILHRDGGHYATEHGLTKATEDAIAAHEQAVGLLRRASEFLGHTEMLSHRQDIRIADSLQFEIDTFLLNSEKGQG